MKVAIAASLLRAISPQSSGGTEAFTNNLIEGLVKKRINVTLFATSDSVTSCKLSSFISSHETTAVSEGSIAVNIPLEVLQAQKIIQQSQDFDIIHNNYWHFYSFSAFSSFTTRPIITTIHNNFWHYPILKKVLVQTHSPKKDVLVFASKAAQKLLDSRLNSKVIYHGIDLSSFPFSKQADDYVLWFSRMTPDKGIKPAMDAAQRSNFKLIVAGTPPIKQNNIEYINKHVNPYFNESIKYIGAPQSGEKIVLYQRAKCLLFPTLMEEQFGLVMVEAMACGTPVIAYNRGAVSEVVADGVTGFIIDPDDTPRAGRGSWIIKKKGIEGLIEAVNRISEIDRAACRTHVEKYFTQERMIEDYIALYEQTCLA